MDLTRTEEEKAYFAKFDASVVRPDVEALFKSGVWTTVKDAMEFKKRKPLFFCLVSLEHPWTRNQPQGALP